MRSPVNWHDRTPIGRIVSRLSKVSYAFLLNGHPQHRVSVGTIYLLLHYFRTLPPSTINSRCNGISSLP
jgi:hypothetical protein